MARFLNASSFWMLKTIFLKAASEKFKVANMFSKVVINLQQLCWLVGWCFMMGHWHSDKSYLFNKKMKSWNLNVNRIRMNMCWQNQADHQIRIDNPELDILKIPPYLANCSVGCVCPYWPPWLTGPRVKKGPTTKMGLSAWKARWETQTLETWAFSVRFRRVFPEWKYFVELMLEYCFLNIFHVWVNTWICLRWLCYFVPW